VFANLLTYLFFCLVQSSLKTDPLWSETCWSTFKYFIILIISTYYILCISWNVKGLALGRNSFVLFCKLYRLLDVKHKTNLKHLSRRKPLLRPHDIKSAPLRSFVIKPSGIWSRVVCSIGNRQFGETAAFTFSVEKIVSKVRESYLNVCYLPD